jgi:type I restriction enzyme S subunit
MNSTWSTVQLGSVVSDLTSSRTFDISPEQEVIDPSIRSATHTLSLAARNLGASVRITRRVRVLPGDLVFSRLHTQNGAFAFAEQEFHATGTFIPLAIDEARVDRRFLYWALHVRVASLSTSDSVGRETYKTANILALQIPLPPLTEQRRIVARIDQLAAGIQEARTLRQKTLEEAEGLAAAASRRGFSDTWPRTQLEELCPVITDGTHQTPQYVEEGAVFLSAQNVKPFRFMPEKHRKVSLDDFRAYTARNKPQRGDVLLTRVGAGIGEAAVVDQDIEFAIYVSLALIRTDKERLLSEFLVHWLNSPAGRESSHRGTLGRGHSQGNLNLKLLRAFLLPVPPVSEQRRIVSTLDLLRGKVDALKRLQTETISELDALLPAILERAFRGNL